MINFEMRKRFNSEIKERFDYLRDTLLAADIFTDDLSGSPLKEKFSALKQLLNTFETELLGDLNSHHCTDKEAKRTIKTIRDFEQKIQIIFHANTLQTRQKELNSLFNFVRRSWFSQLTKTILAAAISAGIILVASSIYAIFVATAPLAVLTAGAVIAGVVGVFSAIVTYRFSENAYEARGKLLKAKLKDIINDPLLEPYIVKREAHLAKYLNTQNDSLDNHFLSKAETVKAKATGFLSHIFGGETKDKVEVKAKESVVAKTTAQTPMLFNKLGGKAVAPVSEIRSAVAKKK